MLLTSSFIDQAIALVGLAVRGRQLASKDMDRSSPFLSNPVVKKKRFQLPVGGRSAPD
jgi:hypothetical protein